MAAVAEGTSFNQSAHGGRHGSCDSDMDTMYPYVSCDATTESWQSEQSWFIQGHETAVVKDSSDDLWFLESDSSSDDMVEYEVISLSSDAEVGLSSTAESPPHMIIEERQEFLVVVNDSDMEFWADYSDDNEETDTEISSQDRWECEICKCINLPYQRFCEQCWTLRPGWIASRPSSPSRSSGFASVTDSLSQETSSSQESSRVSPYEVTSESSRELFLPPFRKSLVANELNGGTDSMPPSSIRPPKRPRLDSELSTDVSDSGQSPSARRCARSAGGDVQGVCTKLMCAASVHQEDLCVICFTNKRSASLIHGSTGHQICCFGCGKKLKLQKKPCPICRRPIQKVIKNYFL